MTRRSEAAWTARGFARLSLRIPAEELAMIRKRATERGLSLAAYLVEAARRLDPEDP